jgi:signal transduction histidine kinase
MAGLNQRPSRLAWYFCGFEKERFFMLADFLEKFRSEILNLVEQKTLKLAGTLSSSEDLRRGLPVFFEHLIGFLRNPHGPSDDGILEGAAEHGKELLRLHYTLSHVVHAYGAMCQAITELAQRKKIQISSREFNELNLCLDIAIASAVSEFQHRSVQASEEREVQHLGFLAHELRNALSSATVAHDMIRKGLVGTGGSTAAVLAENLSHMRNLIDRSLSEVRMRADPEIQVEKFPLNTLVDQILLTAQNQADSKKQALINEVKAEIEIESDRQLLLSALANLIQNALKYTKIAGRIAVRAGLNSQSVIIEVEDECGGIAPDVLDQLFKPFVSSGFDQSGLGLGLTIVQRAVFLLQGTIKIRNNPGIGCAFQLEIPRILRPKSVTKSIPGMTSPQPLPPKD